MHSQNTDGHGGFTGWQGAEVKPAGCPKIQTFRGRHRVICVVSRVAPFLHPETTAAPPGGAREGLLHRFTVV